MSETLSWLTVVALVAVVWLVIGWLVYAKALRVDRLHRQVLGARATLEAQMVHRAQAAAELAALGALDPASAMLLEAAARSALQCEEPVVDDGLDPEPRQAVARAAGASGASAVSGDPGAPDGVDSGEPDDGEEGQAGRSRSVVESDLTRVIRTVLDPATRQALGTDPVGGPALRWLDRAAYRLVLARRFHNTHVTDACRIRRDVDVRVLHLAGHAPMPRTADVDDDVTAPVDVSQECP